MRTAILAATLLVAATDFVWAQSATGVGVGTGIANSRSQSKAVAISGQGGTGVGTGGNPTATVNVTGNPAVSTQNVVTSGETTVKNVPAVFAPGLSAAGLETCLGSVSGGGAFVGTGFSFGTTIPDPGCAARLDARTLWSMGLKRAAVARLCLNLDIRASMPEVCATYLPQTGGPYAQTSLSEFTAETYTGGQILLIDGNTGKDRLCNDYDAARAHCRAWASAVTHHPRKKVVRLSKPAELKSVGPKPTDPPT